MFSSKGLTSSEANHVTNVTKELVKDLTKSDFKLFTSTVIKSGIEYPLDENVKKETWVEDIKRTGELYSLSAWLKSAIKLKEQMLDEVANSKYKNNDILELETHPTFPNTSFDEYLNTLTVKERNEYLSNEAMASHIGKFVHSFDTVREMSDNFQPTSFQHLQGEILTVKNKRLYTKEELLEGFFDLQKQHRESEKVVNLYKARHKEWVKTVSDNHTEEVKAIDFRNAEKRNALINKQEKERLEFEAEKREKMKEISNLKIEIPNDLQNILDYVNTYAKK